MTKVTNTNIANTSYNICWAIVQKGNQKWLGQIYWQTGNEDSTVYAQLSWIMAMSPELALKTLTL